MSKLCIVEDLLLFGNCIVVAKCLQAETLSKIHSGHQGLHHCPQRISAKLLWPGITNQME